MLAMPVAARKMSVMGMQIKTVNRIPMAPG